MASMRDIKRRRVSIQSTQQITKAMKLVSTVKLQRAKARAEKSQTYFQSMYQTVISMMEKSGYMDHPYMKPNASGKKAVIAITSNRGLAGGYNSNIVKLVDGNGWNKEDVLIYAIGKKGRDALKRKGYEVISDESEMINEPLFSDAQILCDKILEAYSNGEIGEIYLAYTHFKNTVSHIPTLLKLLPVDLEEAAEKSDVETEGSDKTLMNYEPEETEALNMIIPKYVTSLIYGALVEAVASENGARMQAMDSATSNAEEMIDHLELQYNRARQGHITQELTEIIGGAEALSN
ncbi:MAG: ATP synthase F1 subunit gamma [Lachnospiraceae bacterium]|nr:ATP synthase F1 subunit gamma [Lachnospiraceae bacterium]MCR4684439.1 ATP synthase F1 subunit gamma [Lachnospiraceae bacterium]